MTMVTETKQLNKAVIYCRVSTKEQAEEGNSLATQERNCREYCSKNNFEIAKVFIEDGESAKTADRTELQKLLKFCCDKKQQIKAVIIYKIDRLSRNTDDYSQLRILLKRYAVEIKSTSEYFENTPAGRFMENIIANVAQFDNDVRTERSLGGMKEAVRTGRYVWMAPVGYANKKIEGKSTIAPNEKAIIVRKAFELMAENRYTIDGIRDTIFSMGLTTRNGKPIARSEFYKMLNDRLYTGWIHKFGQIFKGAFEPIISEELFNRVQFLMKGKKSAGIYRKENPDFPLRRFIKDETGNNLTGAWSKGSSQKYAYYRSVQLKLQWRKELLEKEYLKFIDSYAVDKTIFDNLMSKITYKLSVNSDEIKSNVIFLKKLRSELKEKQILLVEKNLNKIITDAILKGQLEKIEEQIWDIDKKLTSYQDNKVNSKLLLDYSKEFLLHPATTWLKASFETKLELQWFQFPKGITYNGNKFQTSKISSLFNLKELFSNQMSVNVPYSGLDYEHIDSTTSSPSFESIPAIREFVSELQTLERIMNPPAVKEEDSFLSLAA